jgi:hypothetical protein
MGKKVAVFFSHFSWFFELGKSRISRLFLRFLGELPTFLIFYGERKKEFFHQKVILWKYLGNINRDLLQNR